MSVVHPLGPFGLILFRAVGLDRCPRKVLEVVIRGSGSEETDRLLEASDPQEREQA